MSFNTLAFALFLPLVFVVYWIIFGKSYKQQNIFLLFASYIFYGWWDWRFCGLLLTSTLLAYSCSLAGKHKGFWTAVSVTGNLFILCAFKYFDFFSENLTALFDTFGVALDSFTVNVLLPVGISFYTFQAVSYSVDVYKKRTKACRDFVPVALYISFFPQLVAGPIERSTQLLPQFLIPRNWDYDEAVEGMRLILWGLFKKCVVADSIAYWVDIAYSEHIGYGGFGNSFWCSVGIIGFLLQIYGDFSGYSDIAKGSAKLMGFKLMDNFLYPLFSRNTIELWHRWHRSLMLWLKEYVYIPLGGSRKGNRYLNIMIVFFISGLWHGAEWSFIVWGVACGLWYVAAILLKAEKYNPLSGVQAHRKDLPSITITFMIFSLICVMIRAENIEQAINMYQSSWEAFTVITAISLIIAYILKHLSISLRALTISLSIVLIAGCIAFPKFVIPSILGFFGFLCAIFMLIAEWKGRGTHFALQHMPDSRLKRALIYLALYLLIFTCSLGDGQQFIYYRF